jgi:cyanophycinase-like exopeptidase
MSALVCLQGGAEFGPACQDMDRRVLADAGDGPVVVLASAAAQGRDYATAGRHAEAYYSGLGATVLVAPDPRVDVEGALAAVRSAALVVLPGGSPSRLAHALVGTAVGKAVAAAPALSGASAGAMVLCATTVLPDAPGRPLADGLGVVPNAIVLPHFTGSVRWLRLADAPALVLGLPECSGVLVTGRRFEAVGAEPSTIYVAGMSRELAVGDVWEAS